MSLRFESQYDNKGKSHISLNNKRLPLNHFKGNKNILCGVSMYNNYRKLLKVYEDIKDMRFNNHQFGFYSWI